MKQKPLRVCVLTHTFPKSKHDHTAPFMHDFALGLSQAGAKVFVLTPYINGLRASRKGYSLRVYKYVFPKSLHKLGYSRAMDSDIKLKAYNYALIPFMVVGGTISLIKLIKKEKIDIVNVHWILPNGLIAYIASLVTGVKYVVTLPGTDIYMMQKNSVFEWISMVIGKRASAITSNNRLFIDQVSKLVADKPTEVISYPASVSPLSKRKRNLKAQLGLTNNDFVILAVGRFVYKKGFMYLLKAINQIKNNKLHLILVGDGDLRSDFENYVNKHDLQDRVHFTGMVKKDELDDYFDLADVMVTPSVVDIKGNVDGSPVTLVSSMMRGIPQIFTEVIGISEELKDKEFVTIIKSRSVKQLVDSIQRFYKNRSNISRIRRKTKHFATRNLSTKVIGQRYISLFNSLLYA